MDGLGPSFDETQRPPLSPPLWGNQSKLSGNFANPLTQQDLSSVSPDVGPHDSGRNFPTEHADVQSPLHQSDADEDDESVKQLKECSLIYLSLQDCLVKTNRNWKSCQMGVTWLWWFAEVWFARLWWFAKVQRCHEHNQTISSMLHSTPSAS